VNRKVAAERFNAALKLARSDTRLPAEWLERARKVSEAPSKTFIVMLGTALLAKATDAKIDPFALKAGASERGYSARGLCTGVLVPLTVKESVYLPTGGAEPLNNQPFFAEATVGPHLNVGAEGRPHLDYLCKALSAIDRLDQKTALGALAAFLRVRLAASHVLQPWTSGGILGVPELSEKTASFVFEDPERGRRGQALIAACLDLVFRDVRTSRVFDPSRHWPGDVAVFEGDDVTLAAEVKQRQATETDILQHVTRCAHKQVRRALFAPLHPSQPPLALDDLRHRSWQLHGVLLSVVEDVNQALRHAFASSPLPLERALALFPKRMSERLRELDLSATGQAAWSDLFRTHE
jgi:hypothetical protein